MEFSGYTWWSPSCCLKDSNLYVVMCPTDAGLIYFLGSIFFGLCPGLSSSSSFYSFLLVTLLGRFFIYTCWILPDCFSERLLASAHPWPHLCLFPLLQTSQKLLRDQLRSCFCLIPQKLFFIMNSFRQWKGATYSSAKNQQGTPL